MAAPTDPATDLRVGTDAELAGLTVRSHLADGRVVGWAGPIGAGERVAIDAELDRAVPRALAARYGTHDFWRRWTRLECVAKLTGTPVVRLLPLLHASDPAVGVELATLRLTTLRLGTDVVVSVGRM